MPDPIDELRSVLPKAYEVDAFLNKGGQGFVFRGRHKGSPAAIKVFMADVDPRRLTREIELLRRMAHPSVVRVLGTDDVMLHGIAHSVVAYELHTGGDLRAGVAAGMDEKSLLQLGLQIGGAIDVLWAHRIVHRDVKPDNIVRSDDGRFVLVDVGLARHLDRSAITAIGLRAGTPGYMSPEQALGRRNLTIHADVFSLGVTLYELAAKKHPFNRNQALAGSESWRPLHSFASVSEKLSRGIGSMMRASASLRPSRVEELFKSLAQD